MRTRALAAVVLVLVGLLLPRSAFADREETLGLSLQVSLDERPTHICIASKSAGAGANKAIALAELTSAQLEAKQIKSDGLLAASRSDANEATWTIADIAGLVPNLPKTESKPAEAWPGNAPCAVDGAECVSTFSLKRPQPTAEPSQPPVTNYLSCYSDRAPVLGAKPRVAVLLLDYHQKGTVAADLKELTFTGTAGVLKLVMKGDLTKERLSLSVIGGDYVASETGLNVSGNVGVKLTPRCRLHDVRLPQVASREDRKNNTVRLSVAGRESKCLATVSQGERFSMSLPNTGPRLTKSIRFYVGSLGADEAESSAILAAEWTDLEPPGSLMLKYRAISFSWSRNCLYSGTKVKAMCPSAVLAGSATVCEGSPVFAKDDQRNEIPVACTYRACTLSSTHDGDIALPTRVRLTGAGDGEIWTETLATGGQELDGYVDAVDRHVAIDFSAWGSGEGGFRAATNRPAEHITELQIRDAEGRLHYTNAKLNAQVAVPGARCHDRLSYIIVGDRKYATEQGDIENGSLKIKSPADLVHVWSLGIELGGGAYFPAVGAAPDPGHPVHLSKARTFAAGNITVGLRPADWPWHFELMGGLTFSGTDYFPIAKSKGVAAEHESAGYLRPSAELGAYYHFWGVAAGGGGGIVVPIAALQENIERTGDASLRATAFGAIRFKIGRYWQIPVALRMIMNQGVAYHYTDYRGQATRDTFGSFPIFLSVGLRYEY